MKNLWIQTEDPFATWVAVLTPLGGRPLDLLGFVETTLRAGRTYEVFEVEEAPSIGYRRGEEEALASSLRRIHREDGAADLFGFMGAAMAPGAPGSSTARARLAWFDREGQRVESYVTDLGALLSELEPVVDSIPLGFMKHYPPLRVTGPRLSYGSTPLAPTNVASVRPIEVRFAVHSDIWFPWVFGSAHPLCDHRRKFDNRALASLHTPRLNQFLQEVAAAATALGGGWEVDLDETGAEAIAWLDERGIDLHREPPAGRMPLSALDVEWY
ncbi:hypothetical protein [Haliangium sp.]|uniref:hypothetical protein n=1 Tax=Haliangium sp. TaxID=2663208 RepID=UPI003D10C3DC